MRFRCTNNIRLRRGRGRFTLLAAVALLSAGTGHAEMTRVDGAALQVTDGAARAKAEPDPAFHGRIGCASIDLAGNRGIADDAGLGTALTLTRAAAAEGPVGSKAI